MTIANGIVRNLDKDGEENDDVGSKEKHSFEFFVNFDGATESKADGSPQSTVPLFRVSK